MKNKYDVLQLASVNKHLDPFPFITGKTFFNENEYLILKESFPPWEVISEGEKTQNNKRYDLSAEDSLFNKTINPLIKGCIRFLSSREFLHQIFDHFGEEIIKQYPNKYPSIEALKNLKVGIRCLDDFDTCDILLDAQIGCNSPVFDKSSVRGNHLDRPNKLIAGFIYFRNESDESEGGEFVVSNSDGEAIHAVEYSSNNFIFFLNTNHSYHYVSERSVTEEPRLFINFVAEVDDL